MTEALRAVIEEAWERRESLAADEQIGRAHV